MEKGSPKITSPIKPPEISTMTHEENEEIHNQLSKLENQLNELSDRSSDKP
jgi:sugar-specific transcriptional regulator TrmB